MHDFIVKKFGIKDLIAIEKLHAENNHFPLPSLDNTYEARILERNGVCVGLGFVRKTSEVGFILDNSLSNLSKAEGIDLLYSESMKILVNNKFKDTHCFVLNGGEEFADYIVKHYGFQRDLGIPLHLNL